MARSHVFVIRGDITHLRCDAWMLPSDSKYQVTESWTSTPGLLEAVDRTRDEAYSEGGRYALPLADWNQNEPLPVLTAVPLFGFQQADELRPRIEDFIRVGASESERRRVARGEERQDRTLLAMPSFGTAGGGGELLTGTVLEVILDQARTTAAEVGVDVVLVLRDEKTFALAQMKRRSSKSWTGLDEHLLDEAKRLSGFAKTGRLVPFMGAGVSASARAPMWGELIGLLAEDIELSDADRSDLRNSGLDLLDQAAFLRSRYEDESQSAGAAEVAARPTFNDLIAQRVDVTSYGLAPALLAGLGSEQAITMNYDRLFEIASEDAGDLRTVIPDNAVNGEKWLLKLHGSVTDPETIVLTRDDYLGYHSSRTVLASMVKATLVTHHLLFVGFGLKDDHFHEIIHDVRRALPQGPGDANGFATALTLSEDRVHESLWRNTLHIVPMSGSDGKSETGANIDYSVPARTMEIFLDAVLAFSTDSHSYLLSDQFEHALDDDERRLRNALLALNSATHDGERKTAAWTVVQKSLMDLGLSKNGMSVERE